VRHQIVLAEKLQQCQRDFGEARLAAQLRVADAVDAQRVVRHVALRVDQRMEYILCRQPVDQLDRGNLNHTVTRRGVEAGGFRVEQNGAGHGRSPLIRRRSVRRAWCRERPVLTTRSA
jgi:hypothetical protein